MSNKPPLPSHLVMYDKPDPQLWRHVKTGDVYEIIGECWIENLGVEGYTYRRLAKERPAHIDRAKTEFMDGRFERYGAPRKDSRYREITVLDNKIMIDDQTNEVTLVTTKGVSILISGGNVQINSPNSLTIAE